MSENAADWLRAMMDRWEAEDAIPWLWAMVAQAASMALLEYVDPDYFDRLYVDPSMPEWPMEPDD